MKVIGLIRKNILWIFIIILPIFCFITRKLSKPIYSNPFIELNGNSFFGSENFIFKNDSTKKETFGIKNYKNIRLFVETKYNTIILYFTLSQHIYYDDYDLSFSIIINISKSSLILNNYSIFYIENFQNNSNVVKIKENKNNFITNYFSKKTISLNFFFLQYAKNNSKIESALFFEDFYLLLNLKKEKLTYKFFYLLEITIDLLIHTGLFGTIFWENNFQNIYHLFTYILWAKINFINAHFQDLFKVGIPIMKLLLFYFHLVIYGEFILSISDIVTIFLIIWTLTTVITFTCIIFEIENNYYYCYHNKIVNNEIVIKKKNNNFRHSYLTFILLFIFVNLPFQSLYIQTLPLISQNSNQKEKIFYLFEIRCNLYFTNIGY